MSASTTQRNADILIQTYLPSTSSSSTNGLLGQNIPLPLAIPQITFDDREEPSFARGHSPALADLGLSQQIMLNFVDGLNLAMAASPPLRIVGASPVVGFVPYRWAKLPSNSIQIDPQTKHRILSKSLSDLYLRSANLTLFKPRRLVARICTTPAMLVLLSKSPENPDDDDALTKVGRGTLTVAQHLPITYLVRKAIKANEAKKLKKSQDEAIYHPIGRRRLALLTGRSLSLSTGGFPPHTTHDVMQIMTIYGVSMSGTREEKKNSEKWRAMARFEEAGVLSENSCIDHSVGKGGRIMARAERRRTQIRGGKLGSPIQRSESPNGVDEELLETWATDRLLWVVIMPIEKDSTIEDIVLAEDTANEEYADENLWKSEMLFESEEMVDGVS